MCCGMFFLYKKGVCVISSKQLAVFLVTPIYPFLPYNENKISNYGPHIRHLTPPIIAKIHANNVKQYGIKQHHRQDKCIPRNPVVIVFL